MPPSASTTTPTIDRKTLKRPDEFAQSVRSVFERLQSQTTLLLGVLGGLLAIGLGLGFWLNHRDGQRTEALNALYLARKSVEDQYKAIAAKLPPTVVPADPAVKDSKPTTTPASVDQVEFKKLDVDAELAPTVALYRQVIDRFSGTRAAFDARLGLGDLYFNHGEPSKAAPWYKLAVDTAPASFEKSLALYSWGYALAGSGQHKLAVDAYSQAIKLGEAGLKSELLMATARAWEAAGDVGQARAAYDQVISQLPNTDASRAAEAQKARLQ